MKLKNILITSAMAASALVTVPASAAGVFGELGGPGSGANDFIAASPTLAPYFTNSVPNTGQSPRIEGFFGSNLYLSNNTDLTIEFFGAEAGYKNDFYYDNVKLFTTDGLASTASFTAVPASVTVLNASAGLMNFKFVLNGNGGGAGVGTVANGANGAVLTTPNFFTSFGDLVANPGLKLPDTYNDDTTRGSGSYVWLFLDDGGAGPDDNHDDMMIRITAKNGTIPEPATLGLLGLGLVGLGALRRRKTA